MRAVERPGARKAAPAPTAGGATAKPKLRPAEKPSTSRAAAPKPASARRPSPQLVFRWWLVPVAVAAALLLFVLGFYPVARVQYREVRQQTKLHAELKALESRNKRLSAQVAALRTPQGVENLARTQLNMVRAGESLAVVVDGSTQTTQTGPPIPDSENLAIARTSGPWTAFLDAFFGVNTR